MDATPHAGARVVGHGALLRAAFEHALIAALLLGAFFLLPHALFADGQVRFLSLTALLRERAVVNDSYSMVGPIFSAPLWYLGNFVESPGWWCARYNVFVAAFGAYASLWLLRRHIDASLARRFVIALLVAGMLPNHLRAYYGEVFTAVMLGTGTLAITCGRPIFGWALVVTGAVNTPATLIAAGFLSVAITLQLKRVRHLLPMLVALGLVLLENRLRRGSILATGYDGNHGFPTLLPYSGKPGFSYPFFFGVMSLLFAYGKGLVFFATGVFLRAKEAMLVVGPMSERFDGLDILRGRWLIMVAGLFVVYASWWSWYGGWSWGPRFFLFASWPAALVLVARAAATPALGRDLITLGALTLAFWVGVSGGIYDSEGLSALCESESYRFESLCWYVPEFSPLWHPFVRGLWRPTPLLAYAGIGGAAYLWLAGPLWLRVGKALATSIGTWARRIGPLRSWRV